MNIQNGLECLNVGQLNIAVIKKIWFSFSKLSRRERRVEITHCIRRITVTTGAFPQVYDIHFKIDFEVCTCVGGAPWFIANSFTTHSLNSLSLLLTQSITQSNQHKDNHTSSYSFKMLYVQ